MASAAKNAHIPEHLPAVVVTGGSSGIGLAIARRFAAAGHAVALVARGRERLEAAAGGMRSGANVAVITIASDVTSAGACASIDSALTSNGLYCDVLVNAAGIGLAGPFGSHSSEEIDALLALNVAALTRLMRHVLPAMRARSRGGVLNVASLGGMVPGPNQAAYYASKSYVISLTEAVAQECRGSGVRIAVVAPGPVETGFHAAMGAERSPYRRLVPALSPEVVARSAYRWFRLGRTVIVPGTAGSLMAVALRVLPHPLTVPVVGWLLRKP